MALLILKNVTYAQSQGNILENISFSLAKGNITTLVGPNGAGKTTLIKIVLGILRPTQGNVLKTEGMAVGYMPQKIRLNPLLPLTVRCFLKLAYAGFRKNQHDEIRSICHEVGICHLLERSLFVLSGGEFQRVMLARALLRNPHLLILDEPAQGLDVLGQQDMYSLIQRIRDERACGILLVSHDLHFVMEASDNVICLNKHICCSGHPEHIQENPQYHALFPGVALYRHRHTHRHDGEGTCSHETPL